MSGGVGAPFGLPSSTSVGSPLTLNTGAPGGSNSGNIFARSQGSFVSSPLATSPPVTAMEVDGEDSAPGGMLQRQQTKVKLKLGKN